MTEESNAHREDHQEGDLDTRASAGGGPTGGSEGSSAGLERVTLYGWRYYRLKAMQAQAEDGSFVREAPYLEGMHNEPVTSRLSPEAYCKRNKHWINFEHGDVPDERCGCGYYIMQDKPTREQTSSYITDIPCRVMGLGPTIIGEYAHRVRRYRLLAIYYPACDAYFLEEYTKQALQDIAKRLEVPLLLPGDALWERNKIWLPGYAMSTQDQFYWTAEYF